MTEQFLNDSDIGATLKQMCCERVPKRVRADLDRQVSCACGIGDCLPNGLPTEPPAPAIKKYGRATSSGPSER